MRKSEIKHIKKQLVISNAIKIKVFGVIYLSVILYDLFFFSAFLRKKFNLYENHSERLFYEKIQLFNENEFEWIKNERIDCLKIHTLISLLKLFSETFLSIKLYLFDDISIVCSFKFSSLQSGDSL